MPTLLTPIASIRGVGAVLAERFRSLGLESLQDALLYFPIRHEDFRHQTTIDQIQGGMDVTLQVTIASLQHRQAWRRHMSMTVAKVTDDSGAVLPITWFNLPFLKDVLKRGDEIFVSGRIARRGEHLEMHNPTYEKVVDRPSHAALVPIYRTVGGLSQRQIRKIIAIAADNADMMPETLPHDILDTYHLPHRAMALRHIHFPPDDASAKAAVDRMKFEELLVWQLQWRRVRQAYAARQAPVLGFDEHHVRQFVQRLPFDLTDDQRLAAWQIIQDMNQAKPMYRLLQGDVGAGKTIVAAIAAYNTILNHAQVAFLAPTVILAEQHFATLSPLFAKQEIPVALLTGAGVKLSTEPGLVSPEIFLSGLRMGTIPLVIGTHALLDEKLLFHRLGLVMIDEQQRFGVQQRQALLAAKKDIAPHFLSLTATPIPRTLALFLTGQLSVTMIKHKPTGRPAITSKVIGPTERENIDQAIAETIARGEQAFIITPRIEEDDAQGARATTAEHARLKELFSSAAVGLVHGAMKPSERIDIMRQFRDKKIDVLVATTVIEVGVDVPNATLMVIENADHFGLAQLHQLRGRIGRGEKASTCLFVTDKEDAASRQRLERVASTNDGFALAQRDLEERGGGELYGVRQSGLPDWKMASLADTQIMDHASRAAETLLQNRPDIVAMLLGEATLAAPVLHRE